MGDESEKQARDQVIVKLVLQIRSKIESMKSVLKSAELRLCIIVIRLDIIIFGSDLESTHL